MQNNNIQKFVSQQNCVAVTSSAGVIRTVHYGIAREPVTREDSLISGPFNVCFRSCL